MDFALRGVEVAGGRWVVYQCSERAAFGLLIIGEPSGAIRQPFRLAPWATWTT